MFNKTAKFDFLNNGDLSPTLLVCRYGYNGPYSWTNTDLWFPSQQSRFGRFGVLFFAISK